jgi:hypothetical protein
VEAAAAAAVVAVAAYLMRNALLASFEGRSLGMELSTIQRRIASGVSESEAVSCGSDFSELGKAGCSWLHHHVHRVGAWLDLLYLCVDSVSGVVDWWVDGSGARRMFV